MLTRAKKEEIVAGLKTSIEESKAVFLTNLIGVGANDSVAIRRKVREADGKVIVTRNTLFKRAAAGTHLEDLFKDVKGPHAIAFAFKDAPGVAKVIYEAGKENDLIDFKGGFLGDKALSAAEVEQLAQLPSRDEMLGTVLATMMAPVSAFARVLHAINEKKAEGAPVEAAPAAEEAPKEAAAEEAPATEAKTEEVKTEDAGTDAPADENKE